MKIFVTGCAGFIGFHVCRKLLTEGYEVIGMDNMNKYYDVQLKKNRLKELIKQPEFEFFEWDILNLKDIRNTPSIRNADTVIHLAAQAGVRHSLVHPQDYIDNNITGFLNILTYCKDIGEKKLIYASSSSVYGDEFQPFSEWASCNTPLNIYAVSKKTNELMSSAFHSLYGLKSTGLRFFTVYGPWGRPDMALFKFTKNIIEGQEIEVYNHGNMLRDFTYVDDIVEGIFNIMLKEPTQKILNIGQGKPCHLLDFVREIESKLGMEAKIKLLPMQQGDIQSTYCNTKNLEDFTGYRPSTTIKEGISKFIDWYLDYYCGEIK